MSLHLHERRDFQVALFGNLGEVNGPGRRAGVNDAAIGMSDEDNRTLFSVDDALRRREIIGERVSGICTAMT